MALITKTKNIIQHKKNNNMETYVDLKRIEKALKMAIESVHDTALRNAERYGQKSFDAFDAKIEISELGTKYDYSVCGDPVYARLETASNDAAEALKQRSDFLKTIRQKLDFIDEETGECAVIYPPVKSSKTGLKIKLK